MFFLNHHVICTWQIQYVLSLVALHNWALQIQAALMPNLLARRGFHPHIAIEICVFVSLFDPTTYWRPLPAGDKQNSHSWPSLGSAKATGGELHDEWLLCPPACLSQSSTVKLLQGKYKALPGGLRTCLNDLPKTGWMVEWQRHTCFVNTIFLTTAANWKSILYNCKDSEAPQSWSINESRRV